MVSTYGRQHPIFKASDLEDNFAIALERCGANSIATSPLKFESWRELEQIIADLYPADSVDQDIWAQAGGDFSRLRLIGTGRGNWFAALRMLKLGGGHCINRRTLIEAALNDVPHHLRSLPWRKTAMSRSLSREWCNDLVNDLVRLVSTEIWTPFLAYTSGSPCAKAPLREVS